jgi:hypothetical protein
VTKVALSTASCVAALGAAALLAIPSCAHDIAQDAMSGVTANQAQNQNDPSKQVFRVSAERVVAGGVAELDEPEQRAKIDHVVEEAVQAAVARAFRTAGAVPPGDAARASGDVEGDSPVALLMGQAADAAVAKAVGRLVVDLGGNGEGPLAMSLASTGKNVTSAVAGSARNELTALFPGCTVGDLLPCAERELEKMSQLAATGFSRGVRGTIGWQVLAMGIFVGLQFGLLAGVVGYWAWSNRSHGRVLRTRTT